MPVYLFTIHAYQSWMPDNPRGYVERGKGIQPPNRDIAKTYRAAATEMPFLFGEFEQRVLAWIVWDCCQRRDWRPHAMAFEVTHGHLLLSWRDETPMPEVFRKTKNLMSRELGLQCQPKRKNWFSGSGSKHRVKDRKHFDHLMQNYLPKHSGLVWREGDLPPQTPTSVGG